MPQCQAQNRGRAVYAAPSMPPLRAAASLTLEDHHNGQRGTRNIQIAGIKRGPGSWPKSQPEIHFHTEPSK